MSYSSLVRKPCKGGCGRMPEIGFKGFCSNCRPDLKAEIIEKQKRNNAAKMAGMKLRNLATDEPEIKATKDYAALDRWFKDRRKEMTGKCANCGGATTRDSDTYYKFSIAHLLPKAYFKSVAAHPDNWIELCHFGNSCHTNFDQKTLDIIDLHCFDMVIQKFTKIYPFIASEEKRRIPPILIEYLKTEL